MSENERPAIVSADLQPQTLQLREPFRLAGKKITERQILLLHLRDAEGTISVGEAAPLELHDGVSLDDARSALNQYVELLREAGNALPLEIYEQCKQLVDLPQALAAVDIALWDLEARRAGVQLAKLIDPEADDAVVVNATIDAREPQAAAELASTAAALGYKTLKVKVGDLAEAARLGAIRSAAGPEMLIRVDANGAWKKPGAALTKIALLAEFGLELVEEPVHGAELLNEVQSQCSLPIAIDESATSHDAIAAAGCQAVCLKISSSGGITELLRRAVGAINGGSVVYVASMLDGPVGIAAALHTAAVLRPPLACGLATSGIFEDPEPYLAPVDGMLRLPPGPGLGVWAGS